MLPSPECSAKLPEPPQRVCGNAPDLSLLTNQGLYQLSYLGVDVPLTHTGRIPKPEILS